MKDALDSVVLQSSGLKSHDYFYLKKSSVIYKVYGALLAFFIVALILALDVDRFDPKVILIGSRILVLLPIVILWPANVLGCIYSWKSYKTQEGTSGMRLKYSWLHVLVLLISILSVIGVSALTWEIYSDLQ